MSNDNNASPVLSEPRTVVRLRRGMWSDGRSVHMRTTLTLVRRMSHEPGFWEDVDMVGAEQFLGSITNLNDCPDGLYLVTACNMHRDWESGHIDDYDYELVPYTEAKP